jgi:hypothetical protein
LTVIGFILSPLDGGLDQPLLSTILLVLQLATKIRWWYLKEVGDIKQHLAKKVGSKSSNDPLIIGIHLKFGKERTRLEQGKVLQV